MIQKVPVDIEVNVKRTLPDEKNILIVRVRRSKQGLSVYLKSSCLENYFRQISKGVINNTLWCGHKAYQGFDIRLPQSITQRLDVSHWHGSMFSQQGENDFTLYNCSMLRAVGLCHGVKFLWIGLHPSSSVTNWLTQLQDVVMHIYVLYIKPKEQTICLSIKETLDEGVTTS